MPQEFQVLRCYQCQIFQVHQVKKSNKWTCKMCSEKQSLKKVFFMGTGADCRQNVQRLNMMQRESNEKDSESAVNHGNDVYNPPQTFHNDSRSEDSAYKVMVSGNKWDKYEEQPEEEEEFECDVPEDLANCVLTTQINKGRKRKRNADRSSDYSHQKSRTQKPFDYSTHRFNTDTSDTFNTSLTRLNALCGPISETCDQNEPGISKVSSKIVSSAQMNPISSRCSSASKLKGRASVTECETKGLLEATYNPEGMSPSLEHTQFMENTRTTNKNPFVNKVAESPKQKNDKPLSERNSGNSLIEKNGGSKWGKYAQFNSYEEHEELEDY